MQFRVKRFGCAQCETEAPACIEIANILNACIWRAAYDVTQSILIESVFTAKEFFFVFYPKF